MSLESNKRVPRSSTSLFKIGIGIFVIALGLIVAVGAGAQEEWRITSYQSDIQVQADGVVAIKETIIADFGAIAKHGIFRDLPVVYRDDDGSKFYTSISDIEVAQDGKQAEIQRTSNAANIRIRIGDSDRTITGVHEYVIGYRVTGILQSFEGFDELNWNVTGNDWDAPIDQVSATVRIPASILRAGCFQGVYGSLQLCNDIEQKSRVVSFVSDNLAAHEGLTVAVGYESEIVPILRVEAPPSPGEIIFHPKTLAAALISFVLSAGWLLRRWWRYGRDRYWQRAHLPGVSSIDRKETGQEKILPLGFSQPVAVEYDPPDELRPAEIGVLMDEKADTLDVSATIVDLAARGYLMITEISKKWLFGKVDYSFKRTEKEARKLLKYESLLLSSLFEDDKIVKMSELKNTFYKELAKVKDELYDEVVRKGLFAERPDKVKVSAIGDVFKLALLSLVTGSIGFIVSSQILVGTGGGFFVATVMAGIMVPLMPRKTALGRELYERARGYKLFVSGTEKYRAKWMEDEGLFERVLPYAIMFGVTEKLAEAFKEMGIEPKQPSWYHGAVAFNVANFSASADSFSNSLSSAMASRSGSSGSGGSFSSGGGFSGGGFGGGGGGSW